jgi:hypothetical protein
MLSSLFLLKIQVMHQRVTFEIKIRSDTLLGEVKNQIEKHENIEMNKYYIFFESLNLLDLYNSQSIDSILETGSNSKVNNETLYTFYLIHKDQYKEMLESIKCLHCDVHTFNKANLFCSTCNLLICDRCKLTTCSSHKKIYDQALVLSTYFMKLQQFEKRFEHLIENTRLTDYKKVVEEMEEKFLKLIDKETEDIAQQAEEIKFIVDQIKNLETYRIERFLESGINKLKSFKSQARWVLSVFKQTHQDLEMKKYEIDAFSKLKTEKKIDYLKKIQHRNIELLEKNSIIEKTIERFNNLEEYDLAHLLETNRDETFTLTLKKLKDLFEKKITKLEMKIESEECEVLFRRMENFKSKLFKSKVYNPSMNFANSERAGHYILQPIDLSANMNIFNIKEKTISTLDLSFNKVTIPDLQYFPKFNRHININGKLYVTGGEIDSLTINHVLQVDCYTYEIINLKGMKFCRSAHTLVNLNNSSIVAISGAYGENTSEIYSIDKDTWTLLSTVNYDRIGACALVYNNESIYLFFGKKFEVNEKKWTFVQVVERIQLYESYPKWMTVNFKSKSIEVCREICFASLICMPNEKVYVFGGQYLKGENIENLTYCLLINVEEMTFDSTELTLPKYSNFLENSFYFYNSTAFNFDNEGSILLYSSIYNEMWLIDSNN